MTVAGLGSIARSGLRIGLLIGVSAAVLDVGAGAVATRRVASALRDLPGLEVAGVSVDPIGGRAEMRGLLLSRDGFTVAVGRTAFSSPTGFSLVTPAWAQSATVTMDDVKVSAGHVVYRVPHLELRGTALTAGDLTAMLDLSGPMPMQARLARLTAAAIVAPSVIVETGAADAAAKPASATLHDVSLTDVAAGRIGILAAAGFDVADAGADAKAGAPIEAGRIWVTALDLPLALRILQGTRTDPAEAPRPLYAGASVEAVKVRKGDTVAITIGAMRSGALRGRPLMRSIADTVALSERPSYEATPAERAGLADAVIDSMMSASLDHLEVDDVAFKGEGNDHGSFSLDRVAIDGLGGLKLGALAIDGVSLSTPDADLTLGHAALVGFDETRLIEVLRVALLQSGMAGIGAGLASTSLADPSRPSLAVNALRISVPTPNRSGNAADGTRGMVEVPNFSAGQGPVPGGKAINSRSEIRVIYDVPRHPTDPELKTLVDSGVDRLDIGADYSITYDPTSLRLSLDRVALDGQGLGSVTVGAVLGNVSAATMRAPRNMSDAELSRPNLGQITIESFTLSVVNRGLVEKALPRIAASAKTSVPLFKAELKTGAQVNLVQILGDTPAAKQLGDAVSTFIDDPRTFTLTAIVPNGLTVEALQKASGDPKALFGNLALQATADR